MRKKEPPVVVITGASAGVGRATARKFAKRGAHIGLIARGRDGLEAAKREVEELGGRAVIQIVDVSDAAKVEAAADAIEEQLGPIDVWVNNAMTSVFSPVSEMTPDDFRRVTEVTYLGYVWGTLAALKRMKPRDRGVVVQVGSALAYRGIPLQSAYCAAKHAIQGFTESLRCELLHEKCGVHICMVQMPALNTPQFDWVKSRLPKRAQPVPPIFQPEVAADAIIFAATHRRREIFVGGSTVKAIIADKFMPGILDRILARKGIRAQQTQEPVEAKRSDNLLWPLPGDRGARGRFDERSRSFSLQFWLSKNRGLMGMAALLSLGIVGCFMIMRRRRQTS